MFKVKIITIGKNKEKWIDLAIKEYEKRLKTTCTITWIIVKDDKALIEQAQKEKNIVCLDEKGKSFTSITFSKKFYYLLENFGSSVTFIIGGAEGIPKIIKDNANLLISFSSLTFTHQMIRIILLEQIYRAIEIKKGTKYHK